MKIILNGEPAETTAATLEELCLTLGHEQTAVATAVDGDFVAIKDRASVNISQDAKIEIVSPRQGG